MARARPRTVALPKQPLTIQLTEDVPVPAHLWALYGAWTERQLDTHIAALVRDFGGEHHHIPDSRKMGEAGLPDHLCVLPNTNGLTYLEAKRFYRGRPTLPTVDTFIGGATGHLRKGQETWFRVLRKSGTAVFLVYPTDVPDLPTILMRLSGYTRTAAWVRMAAWERDGVWRLPVSPLLKTGRKRA